LQFDPNKVPNQEGGLKPLYEEGDYDEQQEEMFDEDAKGELKNLDGTKGPINGGKAEETEDNPSLGQPEQQKKMAPDENGNYPEPNENNDSEGENESADNDFTRLKKKLREEADQQERDRQLRRRLEELVCPGAPKAKIINDSIMFDAME
jgi:hypothetical protein